MKIFVSVERPLIKSESTIVSE